MNPQNTSVLDLSMKTTIAKPDIDPMKFMLHLFLSRKYEECLKLIEVASSHMNTGELLILKAGCWTHLGINHEKVVTELTNLTKEKPSNGFAHYGLGLNLYLNGKLVECLEPFNEAIKLNAGAMTRASTYKKNAENCLNLMNDATMEIEHNNITKAFEMLSLASLIDPDNKSMREIVKEKSNDFLQLLVTRLEGQILSADDLETRLNHVEFLINSNKLEQAQNIMPKEEQLLSARGCFVRGRLAYMKGSLKASLLCFGKALEFNADMTEALEYSQKATKFVELIEGATKKMSERDDQTALEMLTTALGVDTDNKRIIQAVYFQRSMCKLNLQKQNEAFEDYLMFESFQNQTGMIMDGIKF